VYLLPFVAHYNTVASEYDHHHGHVYEFLATVALKHLNLSPDDRLVEIGGGTGEVAHLLWKMAGTPVTSVQLVLIKFVTPSVQTTHLPHFVETEINTPQRAHLLLIRTFLFQIGAKL